MAERAIISGASNLYKLKEVSEEYYNKLPKQCKVVVDILKENENELTKADFRAKLIEATETLITVGEGDKAKQVPRFETGQDVMAVLRYYSIKLVKDGVMEIVKPPKKETTIKVTKNKKGAKVEAPADVTVEAEADAGNAPVGAEVSILD